MADTDAPPADDERVILKPDTAGGVTVEKFGASTYFNVAQWAQLLESIEELELDEEKTTAPETPKKSTTASR